MVAPFEVAHLFEQGLSPQVFLAYCLKACHFPLAAGSFKKVDLEFRTVLHRSFHVLYPQGPPSTTPWFLLSIEGHAPAAAIYPFASGNGAVLPEVLVALWQEYHRRARLPLGAGHQVIPGCCVFPRPGDHTGFTVPEDWRDKAISKF